MHNRGAKLYLFGAKDPALLDTIPKVDASLQRLAHHITLLIEDLASFKDPLDQKIDTDLKRIYSVARAACRSSVALISLAATLKVWVLDLESHG